MADPTLIALLLAGGLLSATPAHAGTSVASPPTLAVQSPPRLVAVPGSPVLYGPREPYTLFVYRGRYYSFHRGTWFLAAGPGNAFLDVELQTSPTDLRKLVETVLRRGCPVVAIPASAIDRWQRDDLASWRLVLDWLVSRGTRIVGSG